MFEKATDHNSLSDIKSIKEIGEWEDAKNKLANTIV